jgi:hypothetical protein
LKIGGSALSPLKTRVPAPFRCTAIRESGPPFDSEVASRRGVVVYTRGFVSYNTFSAPKWSQVRNIRLAETEFRLVVDTKGTLDRFGSRSGIRCGWSSLSPSANARTRRRTGLVAADDSLFLHHAFGVSLSLLE